jgi:anti-sigma factor RsiW
MNAKQEAPERQEIEELLPWHAAGTLSRRDAQRVEEALARDPELARRYALVREELGETISLNETLGAPSARALENLFAKIDAEPARQPTTSLNLGGRIGEFLAGLSPRTLAWSATARCTGDRGAGQISRGHHAEGNEEDGLRNRIGSQHRSGRGRVCLDPVCTAGIVRRRHQIPRNQQAVDRGGADGRRTL